MVDSEDAHVRSDGAPSFVSQDLLHKQWTSHATNHSSSVSTRPLYEVFLSFRGPDTHCCFADCLYTSLTESGIGVFRDEEELERGEEIIPQLIQAIKQSKISTPIISKGYGSSKSCLMELEQMVKCGDNESHIIIPSSATSTRHMYAIARALLGSPWVGIKSAKLMAASLIPGSLLSVGSEI